MQNAHATPGIQGADPHDISTSPSALEVFGVPGSPGEKEACERKWGWQYVCGFEKGKTKSAEDGDKIHIILENYIKTGEIDHTDPRLGAIASSGTHLIPPVVHEIEVKGAFRSPTIPGLLYKMRKDFVVHPGIWIPTGHEMVFERGRGNPLIGDHKTTKSIDNYGKSIRDLEHDVQAIVYAKSELDRWAPFGIDGVDGRWIYYETGLTRRAAKRDFFLPAASIEEKFSKIELRASRLFGIVQASRIEDGNDAERKRLRVLSLPYNVNACSAFGGCPFEGQCNLSPAERLSASFRQFAQQTFGDSTHMQNAPNGFAQQFATAPGPVPVAAQQFAPPPLAPQVSPNGMPLTAPNGMPLPPAVIDTGMVFDPASNNYYDVKATIESHGIAAIAGLLDACALRHQQTSAPQAAPAPAPAPVPVPAAAPPPVPGFLAGYAVNPPEGPAPQAAPAPAPQPTAPPAGADDENGADGLKGKAAIQAKIDAEVMAGTFKAAPPYARTGKGRRTNEEIEQDLRWQKTQALGLTQQPAAAPVQSAPTGYVPGPVVAQAEAPLTGWLEDYRKYSAMAANALARHLAGHTK